MQQKFCIALAGNPNCGKTSIFNLLTGTRQHVGNYPGVTVESKSGEFNLDSFQIELLDLPGVYSLSSSSPEEEVVFDELTKKGIDLIINVIDSTIPQRSLYLTTQLAELHIPMLLAFNMADEAIKKGLSFDFKKLSTYFGAPIVSTVGAKSDGCSALIQKLREYLPVLNEHGMPMLSYGGDFDDAIRAISERIQALHVACYEHIPARFFAIKLLEHDSSVMKIKEFETVYSEVETQIEHLSDKHAIVADTFMADRRYAMLSGACRDSISWTKEHRREISDKIDSVITNKILGLPIFLLILYITFSLTFFCATPFMEWIESFFDVLNGLIRTAWDEKTLPVLRDMITDGVISGVGGVLVFLPNILFLFFAIAILEDSGYMSRAAFVMDGIMRKFGLQGRSFVPLILGFGCNVPAIMATRVIESDRDRKITIMILPLMSCGARLPIYALIIPAFFHGMYRSTVLWLIYLIGVVISLVAARFLKSTLFQGKGEVYLMELPPYRLPSFRSMFFHMWDHTKSYLRKAGTIILGASVVLYILNHYPKNPDLQNWYQTEIERIQTANALNEQQIQLLQESNLCIEEDELELSLKAMLSKENMSQLTETLREDDTFLATPQWKKFVAKRTHDELMRLENTFISRQLEYTMACRIGKFFEPMFQWIGFDWRIATASLSGLVAKEVFVSQLGILFAGERGANMNENEYDTLHKVLRKHYTPLQGFCIMLFSLLSVPCFATLAVLRRELNSTKLMFVEAVGLFVFAFTLTFVVYQVGSLFGLGSVHL